MSNITPFKFQDHEITVLMNDAGEPWFVAKEVSGVLGYSEASAMTRSLDDDEKGLQVLQTQGGTQRVIVINESGLYSAILKSERQEAKRFKKWVTSEVLPSIRRTGSYAGPAIQPQMSAHLRDQVDASILLLRAAAEDLKFAPSALLGSYQKLESHVGVAGLLPAYAVDASATSATGSSDETKSAKELLEMHGVGMSAVAFNRLLVQRGFLEERERPSTKGSGLKKFKVCANLVFGKNLTSASNPRETQPHWYVSKFAELLDLVLPTKRGAAA